MTIEIENNQMRYELVNPINIGKQTAKIFRGELGLKALKGLLIAKKIDYDDVVVCWLPGVLEKKIIEILKISDIFDIYI